MKDIINDTKLCVILLMINTLMQISASSTTPIGVKVLFDFLAVIMGYVIYISMKKESDKRTQYGLVIYATTFMVIAICIAVAGLVNIFDIMYGITWSVAILAYLLSLSNPVLSMLVLLVSQLLSISIQIAGGNSVADTFKSSNGLLIINLIALGLYGYMANKKLDNQNNIKNKLKSIVTYNRKPLRVKSWTQLIIWSLIITSVVYIAKNQLYEQMNSEIGYAVFAAASITIPTFLIIGAISTSVLIVELYIVYIGLELYTLSYLVFIDTSALHIELSTVLIDIAIAIYMFSKYRRQTKQHVEQNENII